MALDDRYRRLPFPEAIDFLRGKINLDTDQWDDITDSGHDAAFVVAGAKGALLAELRQSVDRALAEGLRPEQFRQEFERISQGWTHKGDKAWRSRIIYGTNLRMAYAAGRYLYQLDPDVVQLQPYLQWIHGDSSMPRPVHKALDGRVFRANELPLYPPSGYGCSCRTRSLTEAEVKAKGLAVSDVKRGDLIEYQDDRGVTRQARVEPAPGFDAVPGQTRRSDLEEKLLARLPEDLRKRVQGDMAKIPPEPQQVPSAKANSYQDFQQIGEKLLAPYLPRLEEIERSPEAQRYQELLQERERLRGKPFTPEIERLLEKNSDEIMEARWGLDERRASVMAELFPKLIRLSRSKAEALANQVEFENIPANLEPELRGYLVDYYQLVGDRLTTLDKIIRTADDRAYASKGERLIATSPADIQKHIIWHELSHHLEYSNPILYQAARRWIEDRAEGPPTKLSDLTGQEYLDYETAFPDKFIREYVGRDYISKATEVLSMGLQYFSEPELMGELFSNDRDHFTMMVGMLAKRNRTPR